MGLLSEGSPLSWDETRDLAEHVRREGITQFINIYHTLKDRTGDGLKWGDEVEYMIVHFDEQQRKATLSLRAIDLLNVLNEKENEDPGSVKSLWRPEYAGYMIEGTPGQPFGGLLAHINTVEASMKYRREEIEVLLKEGERVLTLTSFPRLGCGVFTTPPTFPNPRDGASRSLFIPDEVIYPGHPRFRTLTRNIRMRRGEKVAINIPVYRDDNTMNPFIEDFQSLGDDGSSAAAALPDHVYMDAMAFGMGCSCLQLTFQATNINEARNLYDQLTPICPILKHPSFIIMVLKPIMKKNIHSTLVLAKLPFIRFVERTIFYYNGAVNLALTAASPIHHGVLTDIDCRWTVISGSVDDRTKEERGLEPLRRNQFVIPKSRYDSIDSYLSPRGGKYNDKPVIHDPSIYNRLVSSGVDHLLAQHVAHLFIRDTVSLFSEKVHQAPTDTDHFENIQSTNWQTMRFKPPPPNTLIGWRVEFRPCELQVTDFENAAFVVFIVLLTRVILTYDINFLIPISKVDDNMNKAQKRSAVREEVFWFRKKILPPHDNKSPAEVGIEEEYGAMTINHIVNGKEGIFPGLLPLINNYLQSMDVDADTHCTLQRYLSLIRKRASGELLTTASWIRQFVRQHPSYKRDSIVTEDINYDLLKEIESIQDGLKGCPELLGDILESKTKEDVPSSIVKATGTESKEQSDEEEQKEGPS